MCGDPQLAKPLLPHAPPLAHPSALHDLSLEVLGGQDQDTDGLHEACAGAQDPARQTPLSTTRGAGRPQSRGAAALPAALAPSCLPGSLQRPGRYSPLVHFQFDPSVTSTCLAQHLLVERGEAVLSPLCHPGLAPVVAAGTAPTGASLQALTLTSMRVAAVSMAAAVAAISLSTRSPSSSCLTSKPLGRSSWGEDGIKGTAQGWHNLCSGVGHDLAPSHRPSWGTHLPDGADPAQAGRHQTAVSAFHRARVLQGAEVADGLAAALPAQLQQPCAGSASG